MYTIYALEDQRNNNEVFYIGITDDLQARLSQHMRRTSSNQAKDILIREMIKDGYLPVMRTLQIVDTREEALGQEAHWVEHFESLGMPLTNIRRKSFWSSVSSVKIAKVERTELTVGVSDFIRDVIKRAHAMGQSHKDMSWVVDLDGDKYHIYRQVCLEEGVAIE